MQKITKNAFGILTPFEQIYPLVFEYFASTVHIRVFTVA